jgi:hypothetical protein
VTLIAHDEPQSDDPIQPQKGEPLVTLRHGAAFITALPKSEAKPGMAGAATESLLISVENRGRSCMLCVGMMLALHGAMPIPEYDPSEALGTAKAEAGRVTDTRNCRIWIVLTNR